jgi:hypothetical protein
MYENDGGLFHPAVVRDSTQRRSQARENDDDHEHRRGHESPADVKGYLLQGTAHHQSVLFHPEVDSGAAGSPWPATEVESSANSPTRR